MISALKSTLRPKVKKILQICIRSFVNPQPVSYFQTQSIVKILKNCPTRYSFKKGFKNNKVRQYS